MVLEPVTCPICDGTDIVKYGKTSNGKQRFLCRNVACECKTFVRDYSDKGRLPEVKQQVIDMALNGSGIRDTARVLGISTTTVINELKKKEADLCSVNEAFLEASDAKSLQVDIIKIDENQEIINNPEAEMDEMWSYVGNKENQRWLWHAIDRSTGAVLAYVLGRRQDEVFLDLKGLLEPFGITRFYTDDWGAYERHLDPEKHVIGKQNTQRIERKHLTLRTRIKRLVRRTICFSKSTRMHDIVIGLFINRYEFGLAV